MTRNCLSALAIVVLLTIGGAAAGVAQAATFGSEVPLSPVGQQPLSPLGQQNAVRAARDYLDYAPFSRKGLIQQLAYEGYSSEDATFAVDSITVNWNAQAAKAAKNYLDYTAFSGNGLYEQLVYEGYTASQAAYGVSAAGY